MYCKDINLLFIHITKTSGTSVKKALRSKYQVEDIAGINKHHKTALLYSKELDINKIDTVTIVRNPYDRYKSYLNFTNNKDWFNNNNFHFLRPQYEYIYSKDGCLVNDILKFEDRDQINNYFKKYDLVIEHHNATDNIVYEDLTEEQIAFCNKMYKKDFELFNYERIEL